MRFSWDEPRHQVALRFQDRHHLGPHADGRRHPGGSFLRPAVDPQELGVLASDAQDEAAAVDLDQEVVVGDAASERLPRDGPSGPDAFDDRVGAHVRDCGGRGSAAPIASSPSTPRSMGSADGGHGPALDRFD